MKQLILVRHAKAMKSKEGLPDFVRSLTTRGLKQAKKIASKLRKQGIVPELFISSPANRALETAQCFAKGYNYSRKKIVLKDELYGPLSDSEFLTIIKELNDNLKTVIFFGHDPVMSDFVQFLVKDMKENMPTSSVAVIEFKKDNWKTIAKGQGELIFFEYPKRLAKYYTDLKIKVESDVFHQLINIFKKVDEGATAASEKNVKKMAHGTAEDFISMLKVYRKKERKRKVALMKPEKNKTAPGKKPDKAPDTAIEKPIEKKVNKVAEKNVNKVLENSPGNSVNKTSDQETPKQ